MNIYFYTAYQNPRQAAELVRKYGMRPAPHPDLLAKQLATIIAQNGQAALDELAEIHPDFELVKKRIAAVAPAPAPPQHHNACGCGGFNNADGQGGRGKIMTAVSNNSELLLTGGIVVIALALVLGSTKKA